MAVTAASPALAETTLLASAAELRDWARSARPRDRMVYCVGPRVPEGPVKGQVNALVREGLVLTSSVREGERLQHLLIRCRKPAAARAGNGRGDAAQTAILVALARAATRGDRAPTDAELATVARLQTRDQAAWRVRKLKEGGMISVRTVRGPDNRPWRIVGVGGRETAGPKEGGK